MNDHIVLSGLSAGTHTIRLEALYDTSNCNTTSERDVHPCTTTDTFDIFTASLVELPV